MAPMPAPSPSAAPLSGKLPPTACPSSTSASATTWPTTIPPAGDYKAFALNIGGFTGASSGSRTRKPRETRRSSNARSAPMPRSRRGSCELYAVGNTVVYTHGKPPMPPQPWVRHDAMTERPFVPKDFRWCAIRQKPAREHLRAGGERPSAIALGPGGQYLHGARRGIGRGFGAAFLESAARSPASPA